jgi:hypothetical protein
VYSGGIMRTRITLITGLSIVFLFLSIYGTPYVNGQSSPPNSSPGDNETSSTNSALKTENLDPFALKDSSDTANTGNSNDPAQADDGSSANSNSDDDDGSSANSNSDDDDGSSANSNSDDDDGSSANSKNDNSNKDGSGDDKSSEDDKESKDDKKFELPFP